MNKKYLNNQLVKELRDIDSVSIIETLSLTTWFFFKKMFSTSIWWFLIFVIPTIVIIGGGAFLPYMYSFTFLFGATLLFSTVVIYGTLFYPIYNSSIYKNMELTVLKFASIYISLILTTICVDILIATYMALLYFLLVQLQVVFQLDWFWHFKADYVMHWGDIWWGVYVYFLVVSTILDISITFFIQSISKTAKTYYVIGYSYYFMFIIWSGAILMVAPIHNEIGEIALNDNVHHANNWLFWMRWFNPNYGINTFGFSAFAAGTWDEVNNINPAVAGLEQARPWAWTDDKLWNLVKFSSGLYALALFYAAVFIEYIKLKLS